MADADCLFCKIAEGAVPADIVLENDYAVAFRDLNPQAPVHVLVVPREHHPTVAELAAADPKLAAEVLRTCGDVAQHEGVADGYRLVFNTGAPAGQSVFHVHGHVLGGRRMGWPPG
jgi:histidine triad (HIT) family protein